MKKYTTTAGPIGTRRIRSLLAFRHHNPIARLLSMLVAGAMAMFLVAGTGAAYADDTAPAETATETAAAEPAAEPTEEAEEPAEESAEEPAEEPASVDGSSDAPAEGGDVGGDAGGEGAPAEESDAPSVSTALKTLAGDGPVALAVACGDSDANFLIGGFEIDGDECVANHAPALNGLDWEGVDTDSPRYAESLDKFVDDGDTSGFQGGPSKTLLDPLGWSRLNPPNDKSDIERVRVYSQKSGNPEHTFSDFAIDRHPDDGGQGGTGTVTYDVEYNQNPDVPSADETLMVPDRSPGDLWFVFDQQGNESLDYISGWKFSDSNGAGCKAVETTGYWCPLTGVDFQGDTSDDGAFAEGTLDISDAFDQGVCFTFGVVNIRTRTSNEDTSAFKDYIEPLNAITSNCGSLEITKTDADTDEPAGGAVFQVVGDPRPDGDGFGIPGYQLCVYDGPVTDLPDLVTDHPELEDSDTCDELIADGTADGTVTFDPVVAGTYDIAEIVPPPGYMLNGDDTDIQDDVEVVDGQQSTAPFSNRRIWLPLEISKDAAGTFGATYHWTINKEIAPTDDGPWSDETTAVDEGWLKKVVEAGGDTHLYYRLVVEEDGVDTSDYVVTGTIHVDNDNPDTLPNDGEVEATLTESLAGCTLDSNETAFPVVVKVPSGGADFAYTCELGGPIDEPAMNTATVTWDMNDHPQATEDLTPDTDPAHYTDSADSDPFSFTETDPVDKTVTIDDNIGDLAPGWTITYGDEVDGTYEAGPYKFPPELEVGSCSFVITNTATVTGDDQQIATDGDGQDAQDAENGQVCVEDDLAADLTVSESFTRTYLWNIVKDTTTPGPINVANGQVSAHYVVTVEALPFVDSAWAMLGTVTITNPNDFADKQVSDLDVAYSGGGTCVLDGPLPNVPMATEGTPGSAVVDFHCDFTEEPVYDGDVTATVKWDADAESTDDQVSVAMADWVKTLVDEFVKVFDDHAVPGTEDPLFGGVQLKWQDVFDSVDPAAHKVDVEYDHVYSGAILPVAGICKDLVNTAWLTHGADLLLDSDTATVNVCTPAVVVLPPTPQVSPPDTVPNVLPNTGAPDALLLAAGLVLLLGGGTLVIGDRLRRRRS